MALEGGGGNGSIMVGMFVCLFLASQNKSVPAGTKTPSSPVCYVGIVRLRYASHISHPMKTTTMVKLLPPPSAWIKWFCSIQRKVDPSEVLGKAAVEGFSKI